jgi:hypothetical protein
MHLQLGLVQLRSHYGLPSLDDFIVWIGWLICCTCQLDVVKSSFWDRCPLKFVSTLLLGEMLDFAWYRWYGTKLRLLCQVWHVRSSWISKINVLTVTKMGMGMLIIQCDSIFSISFMWDPGDFLGQTSPEILARKAYPVYSRQSWDFRSYKPPWILLSKQTTSAKLIVNRRTVRIPSSP